MIPITMPAAHAANTAPPTRVTLAKSMARNSLCNRNATDPEADAAVGAAAGVMPTTDWRAARVVATASASGTGAAQAGVSAMPAASASGGQAPRQPALQSPSAPDQPALDRPDRPPQSLRRLFVRESLEGTEQDRQPLGVAQPVDLLMDDRAQLVAFQRVVGGHGDVAGLRAFTVVAAGESGARARARPAGPPDGASPPAQSGSWIDRARRASSRNVTWNASSARWPSASTWRQTRSTIGPCRSTSVANAASDASPPRAK